MASVGSGCDDTPPYDKVQTFKDSWGYELFEERQYKGGKAWACTNRTISFDEDKDEYGMFMKLFRYITGANNVEEKNHDDISCKCKITKIG